MKRFRKLLVTVSCIMMLFVAYGGARSECVDSFRQQMHCFIQIVERNDGQFLNIMFFNRCHSGVYARWSTNQMGLTDFVPPGKSIVTQCYNFCNVQSFSYEGVCMGAR